MGDFGGEEIEVNARILYWGIEGAGKTTNLRVIHSKLRPDHRGDLQAVPTRLDPTVCYSVLPIELGQVGGVRTRIQIVAAPGGHEHGPTRKQLLDEVDGVVFVVDTGPDRVDANLESFEELRSALADYGRAVEDVPLVIQYNKRDEGDPFAMEELHRKLSTRGVAAFEATASEGTAVLQTLTTISKRVIRSLRDRTESGGPPAASAPPQQEPQGGPGVEPDLEPQLEPAGLEPAAEPWGTVADADSENETGTLELAPEPMSPEPGIEPSGAETAIDLGNLEPAADPMSPEPDVESLGAEPTLDLESMHPSVDASAVEPSDAETAFDLGSLEPAADPMSPTSDVEPSNAETAFDLDSLEPVAEPTSPPPEAPLAEPAAPGLDADPDLEIDTGSSPDVTQLLDLDEPAAGDREGDGLDPSLLDADDGDATAQTAARAESLFEASFQEATSEVPGGPEPWHIESVGQASKSGERGVRIPLVVCDGSGSRQLTLTIQLEPDQDPTL